MCEKLATRIFIFYSYKDKNASYTRYLNLFFRLLSPLWPLSPSHIFFVSTKFHFDETISLAGLMSFVRSSSSFVRRATFMETLRWDNFCNFGATFLGFGTLFTNIILLWIRNFEKNRTTPTPQKNQKTPKKDLWIFTMGYLANALR